MAPKISIVYQEKLFNAYKDFMSRWVTLLKKYQFKLQPFHAKPSICFHPSQSKYKKVIYAFRVLQSLHQLQHVTEAYWQLLRP